MNKQTEKEPNDLAYKRASIRLDREKIYMGAVTLMSHNFTLTVDRAVSLAVEVWEAAEAAYTKKIDREKSRAQVEETKKQNAELMEDLITVGKGLLPLDDFMSTPKTGCHVCGGWPIYALILPTLTVNGVGRIKIVEDCVDECDIRPVCNRTQCAKGLMEAHSVKAVKEADIILTEILNSNG